MKNIPAPQMRMYWAVKSRASGGAIISDAMPLAQIVMIRHSTTAMPAKTSTAPPISGLIFSGLRSPKSCPITTVTPMASAVITKVIRLSTLLPVETPDSPAREPKRPTTSRSTAPYMA